MFEGGRVKVIVGAFVKSYAYLVKSMGTRVVVNAAVNVGVIVRVFFIGALDGVLVSTEKLIGTEEPMIGIETMNVRALDETTSKGSMGTIEIIGSYEAET